jgi:hypothetical protein
MTGAACPATMCPLFAREGSPWTGDRDVPCIRQACAWWDGRCRGEEAATEQIALAADGLPVLQLGPAAKRSTPAAPRTYDCPRATDCQWQIQAGEALCPPRQALALGLDPRLAGY